MRLLAEGRSVKEIAASFDLSVKTVEAHKYNLMRKLGVHNKVQLVRYAVQHGVVKIDVETQAQVGEALESDVVIRMA